jgi:hypothetical protein
MLVYTTVKDNQGSLSVLNAMRYGFYVPAKTKTCSHGYPTVALLASEEK